MYHFVGSFTTRDHTRDSVGESVGMHDRHVSFNVKVVSPSEPLAWAFVDNKYNAEYLNNKNYDRKLARTEDAPEIITVMEILHARERLS